jgi:DNA-directed RNA polymerase specialized sigma24 family protein
MTMPIQSNHTVTNIHPEPALDLDAFIGRACEGDRDALNVVARELHPRLVREARVHLGHLDVEAEDAVQDLFLAMLEGRVRPPRGRREGRAHLLRLVALFARRRARESRRRRE